MDERIAQGPCFNYDRKYSKGHKCSENKLLCIGYEYEVDQEVETSQDLKLEELTPTISCHALDVISTQKNLKIEGYIKRQGVTVLIDSCSTHNLMNCKLEKPLNYFVYLAPEFQVMIVDGGGT